MQAFAYYNVGYARAVVVVFFVADHAASPCCCCGPGSGWASRCVRLRRGLDASGFGFGVLALVSPGGGSVFLWMLSLSLKNELDNTA